ncbi:MAG: hypothetical protein EBR40_06570 [Proteobacteria bacterium]|nr:hypothetical protein [Pseudomonadota bacterium]
MESLLTLSDADYRAIDLILRLAVALIGGVALLLGLSTMCVGRQLRFPVILASVALGTAAWFESGISRAWQGAFELAGAAYCVTGLPLASEERIIAWAFGLPAIFLCFGLIQLDLRSKFFRNLCWSVLGLALLGPFFNYLFLLGFLSCVTQLRGLVIPASCESSTVCTAANRIALLGMTVGILLTEAGHLHLLPLGKTTDSILVRGELIRSISDILALALPGAALLACILNLSQKEAQNP